MLLVLLALFVCLLSVQFSVTASSRSPRTGAEGNSGIQVPHHLGPCDPPPRQPVRSRFVLVVDGALPSQSFLNINLYAVCSSRCMLDTSPIPLNPEGGQAGKCILPPKCPTEVGVERRWCKRRARPARARAPHIDSAAARSAATAPQTCRQLTTFFATTCVWGRFLASPPHRCRRPPPYNRRQWHGSCQVPAQPSPQGDGRTSACDALPLHGVGWRAEAAVAFGRRRRHRT